MKTLGHVLLTLVVLLCTGSCAKMASKESTSVMLQNPETMEFVKCSLDQWGTRNSFARKDQCVEDYKSQGYVIWDER